MAAYLRNYVESVAELPSELARKFRLMRELDEKAHALQAEAEAASRRRLEEAAQQVRLGTCWQGHSVLLLVLGPCCCTSAYASIACMCRLRQPQLCRHLQSACALPVQRHRAARQLQQPRTSGLRRTWHRCSDIGDLSAPFPRTHACTCSSFSRRARLASPVGHLAVGCLHFSESGG